MFYKRKSLRWRRLTDNWGSEICGSDLKNKESITVKTLILRYVLQLRRPAFNTFVYDLHIIPGIPQHSLLLFQTEVADDDDDDKEKSYSLDLIFFYPNSFDQLLKLFHFPPFLSMKTIHH